jgi:hypothetical protein
LTWTAAGDGSGSGVAGYQLLIGGSLYTVYTPTLTYQLSSLPNGVYTWTVRAFDNAGNLGPLASPYRTFTVAVSLPGILNHFVIGPIAQQYVGTNFAFVITACDSLGAVVPGYNGTLALVDSTGTLMPTTWSAWSSGVATPSVRVQTPRTGDVITATASGISAHSNLFNVVWNPAGSVVLTVSPTTIAVGATAHVTATVLDAGGNPVAASTQVTFTVDKGTIAPQVAFTTNGKATAVFTGTVAGTAALTATASTGPHGNTTVTVVQAGQLDHFVIGPVAQQYVGAGFTLVITAYNSLGAVIPSYNGQLSLVDSTGTLLPATWSAWSSGVARVSPATISQPRTGDVITVTASSVSAHSNSFNVVCNPAGTVQLGVQPALIALGRTAQVTARVLDSSCNLDVTPKQVTFSADKGVMSPQVATTSGGIATVVYTGTAPGTATITATLGSGIHGNATVVVQPPVYLPVVMRNYKPYVPPANGSDLVITGISVTPSAPAAGQSATVKVTIKNQGNQAVPDVWYYISLYIDRAPAGRSDVTDYYAFGLKKLAIGSTYQATIVTLGGSPITFTAGTHTLYAQVDPCWQCSTPDYGFIQETNENNNIFGPFSLNVSGVMESVEQAFSPPSSVAPPPAPTSEP